MKLSIENLKKPSNRKLKRIADWILYTFPLYSALLAAELPVDNHVKIWANVILGLIVITFKAITKFTAEETPDQSGQ
jgi:hypothetical protein